MIETTYINAFVISHLGHYRKNHEDNYFLDKKQIITKSYQSIINLSSKTNSICENDKKKTTKAIFSVSDGMGGHQAGEVASLIAVNKLSEARDYILSANNFDEVINRYQESLLQTNSEIVSRSSREHSLSGMGATLSTLIIFDGQAIGINLGDSRIYQYGQNQLTQLSKDHTEGQRMLDLKLLTVDEVEKFKSRKDLTRYLGMGDEYFVVKGDLTKVVELTDRTWFLLCSDGLTDIVEDSDIQQILERNFNQENVDFAVKELVESALQGSNGKRGGTDNITVVIVEVCPEVNINNFIFKK